MVWQLCALQIRHTLPQLRSAKARHPTSARFWVMALHMQSEQATMETYMSVKTLLLGIVMSVALGFGCSSGQKKGAEEAGESTSEEVEQAGDVIEDGTVDAVEETGEAAEEAGDELEQAGDEAEDKTQEDEQ